MRELKYRSDAGFLRALFWEGATDDAPLLVDIHGGGFCLGSADGDIGLRERLVRETGCAAAALDYRLAPKHPYPAAIDDCRALLLAIKDDPSLCFDRKCIFVMGHSAGGALAVLVARGRGRIAGVILNYPWLEIADNRRKYLPASFPKFMLDRFARQYCKDKSLRATAGVSPVRMSKADVAAFPPTLILTGGSDSLRTDGIRFYELLRSAGAAVRHIEYPAARHAFIETVSSGRMRKNFYTSERAAKEQIDCYERAVQEIKNWIRGV